ncbi:MAG: hypothetical protein ABUS79_06200 [Pseudomonadota bacterium]
MAIDIKRVRFFDGQFLREGDFKAEQTYHSHLRRRMNFLLFQQSGVVPMSPTDLTLEVVNAADKTFKIKAGTAIAQNVKEEEGREIILAEDSAPIDLDLSGIGAGQTAVVSLHWEQASSDLATDGETSEDTRFFEQAVINVGLAKPATPVATGDPYVQLGTIVFDTMVIAATGRETALLRSALIATVPSPIINNVAGITSAAVGPVIMTIQGNNLGGAVLVTFSDPLVTATLGANTATTLDVTVNIAPGATPGPKSFQVSTSSGIGFSPAGVVFNVLQPAPTILGMVGTPSAVVGGPPITMIINGTNLTGASVSFPGAAGITVLPGAIATSGSVTFQVQATAPATLGLKVVRVDTGGGFAISAAPVGLTVLFPPTIASLSGVTSIVANSVATPGIVINGTNLFGGVVSFPTEPTMIVGATSVNAAGTQLTVTLTAPTGMTPTPKTYRVTTGGGAVDSPVAAFLGVTAPVPPPTIGTVTPSTNTTPRPVVLAMTLTGTNLGTASSVSVSGLGITTSNLVVVNATTVTVNFNISGSAPGGARTITINTGGGPFTTSLAVPATAFSVTPI